MVPALGRYRQEDLVLASQPGWLNQRALGQREILSQTIR